jgi:phosphoribosylformylglycinamidine synthase
MVAGKPPRLDLGREAAVGKACRALVAAKLLRSAHDCSEGGIAVALAECCIGGPEKPLGARIETHEMIRGDALLFSESQSRIVVSLSENNLERLQALAAEHNAPMQMIGSVGGTRLVIQPLLQLPVEELRAIWTHGLTAQLR